MDPVYNIRRVFLIAAMNSSNAVISSCLPYTWWHSAGQHSVVVSIHRDMTYPQTAQGSPRQSTPRHNGFSLFRKMY